ncbi:hypothetical protein [Streptomyces rugosispiralis]|uniref:Uncharacterized protein n=1 Tax=Streptomyces rugosispiralis TaxID=2967341 RepID=A0ABT1VDH5_9ACTN|nr:hypothetical protein [Streptomyces rugosispiralis]MCQ8195336.1 hypothetical protein [Streptomyces rugosispiralis]
MTEDTGPVAITWHELRRQVASLAQALTELGVRMGDRVGGGYWMPLFVTTTDGIDVDAVLSEKIRDAIRHGASPPATSPTRSSKPPAYRTPAPARNSKSP